MSQLPSPVKTTPLLRIFTSVVVAVISCLCLLSFKFLAPLQSTQQENTISIHVPSHVETRLVAEGLNTITEEFPYFERVNVLRKEKLLELLNLPEHSNLNSLPTVIELTITPENINSINYRNMQSRVEELIPEAVMEYAIFKQQEAASQKQKNFVYTLTGIALALLLLMGYFSFKYEVKQNHEIVRLSALLGAGPRYVKRAFSVIQWQYFRTAFLFAILVWGGIYVADIYITNDNPVTYSLFYFTELDYLLLASIQPTLMWLLARVFTPLHARDQYFKLIRGRT